MPFPEIYTKILFVAVAVCCTVIAVASVPFYNALHRKQLLSDTRQTVRAKSPIIYILCAVFGLAAGICFAFKDISPADFFLILMIPSAITVSICDSLNGFVPLAGLVFSGICTALRTVAVCFEDSSPWQLLTFLSGGVFGVLIMLLINFIAKKTGADAADAGHIAYIATVFAAAGIVPGTVILAAAEIAALLFYILPVFIIAKKRGDTVKFTSVRYPLAPFLTVCFYAAAIIGIFR